MKKAFATIYIVLILSSLVLSILVITEVSEGFGARSVAESICTSAGQSVLGEYSKDLFDRYGIFAIRNYGDELKDRIKHYISGSIPVSKGFIKLELEDAFVYSDMYPVLNMDLFSKELDKVALESIAKNSVSANIHEERKIGNMQLPSKLLGYSKRESVLLSGGLFELELNKIVEDEYICKVCSYKTRMLQDSYLAYEVEYILFGNNSDAKNIDSLKRSLYELRFATNLAKADPVPVDAATLAIATAKAAIEAKSDVDIILNGGEVDGVDYAGYLRVFLALLSKNEKLARLLDIMQININNVDGIMFSFVHYSFGFDITVKFKKKVIVPIYWGHGQRYRTIEQKHVYK